MIRRRKKKDRSARSFALLKRVVRAYVTPYRARLILAMIAMLIVAGATAANAYMIQPVLDGIFMQKNADLLMILPLIVMGITFLQALADYIQTLQLRYVGQAVVADMQGDLFAHLMHADLTTFHDQTSGRLLSRMTSDIMLLRVSVSTALTGFVKESFSLVFLVAVMFYQSWQMSLLCTDFLVCSTFILKQNQRFCIKLKIEF